jgi:hypothetical protein
MTRTLMLCRLGLAGAATVAVLTACGGSGGSTTASSSTSAARTTSSASTSAATVAAGGGGTFCDQARQFASQVGSAVGGLAQQNPNTGQVLQQVVSQLQGITPPPEIAADWQTALGDLQQLAQALSSTNLSDPQALAQLEQKVTPIEATLETSGQHIDQYLQTKCGIDVGGTASPTS